MTKLPLSHDALAEDEDEFGIPRQPHLEPLPALYLVRGRGALSILAVLGLIAFFSPWVDMTAPEIDVLSGADLARRAGWIWGAGVAWFVLLPVVITRRSIDKMRGARVAAAFLSAVPVVTTSILFLRPPHGRHIPLRFQWGWGLVAFWAIGLVATALAVRVGGRIDDIQVKRGAVVGRGETLH
jgi:hypothetical protein